MNDIQITINNVGDQTTIKINHALNLDSINKVIDALKTILEKENSKLNNQNKEAQQ